MFMGGICFLLIGGPFHYLPCLPQWRPLSAQYLLLLITLSLASFRFPTHTVGDPRRRGFYENIMLTGAVSE
jgi:hypothetical protein